MIAFESLAQKPRIGVSACLLGEPVRYDGAHKRDEFVSAVLSQHFELFPCCPEVGIGLGVPRPAIQLINIDGAVRVRGVHEPERDFTGALQGYAEKMQKAHAGLSGYIFKSRSPSCGLHDAPLLIKNAPELHLMSGMYASEVLRLHPALPVIDELRLHDEAQRAAFIAAVYAHARHRAEAD